jgi:cytochrome c biogenesis protein CcmG, thiol:disulfide interchange protein DsbE
VRRRLLFLLPVALFAIVALYLVLGLSPERDPTLVPSVMIDKPAPDFVLPGLFDDGQGLSNEDLQGQVSLVNFFASWCVPCRAEHPILLRLAREEGVPLYGIAYKDQPNDSRAWLAELGDPFQRIGVDLSGRTAIDFGVYGVPETYVIDREGRVRYRHVGPLTPAVLEETVLPLIAELRS